MHSLFYPVPLKESHTNDYIDEYKDREDLDHPQWCKNCIKCGVVEKYNACSDGKLFETPTIVSTFGHCKNFKWNEKFNGKPEKISFLRKIVLKYYGYTR